MKRVLSALLLTIGVLAGCTTYSGTYQEQLNQRVERAITSATAGPTYSHGIYSYYKEPSIGRVSSEETSSIFTENGTRFVMNLNVSSIVNERYYSINGNGNSMDDFPVLAESEGTFVDYAGEGHPFEISLREINDQVYTYCRTDLLEFFSLSGRLEALQISETMLRMARTVRVDKEDVVASFSSRQDIDYERKRIELFQNIVPENGASEELYEGYSNFAGIADSYAGDNIDETGEEQEPLDYTMGDGDDQIGEPMGDPDEQIALPEDEDLSDSEKTE